MSFSIGIVGLPNAGKSTLFKALTKKQVDIAPYAFSTRDPNIGIVAVPDERLQKISQVIKPEKTTPTTIKFVDIAGLVKNAHQGEGLGNQFLSHIRDCDAMLEVVRAFENDRIEHIEGSLDPQRDMSIIKTELLMKDLETLEKQKELKAIHPVKSPKGGIPPKAELFNRVKEQVDQGKLISELDLTPKQEEQLKEYQFLTAKPTVFVLNYSGQQPQSNLLSLNLKLEQELSELSTQEAQELDLKPQLAQLITACYNTLGLITFFTMTGGKETRAWTLKKGQKASEAGGRVHSDFENKFIKAEVAPWQRLVEAGSWAQARQNGQINTVGKDYIVQDGDVIEFKI